MFLWFERHYSLQICSERWNCHCEVVFGCHVAFVVENQNLTRASRAGKLVLVHNNAPPHKAITVCEFLATAKKPGLCHPAATAFTKFCHSATIMCSQRWKGQWKEHFMIMLNHTSRHDEGLRDSPRDGPTEIHPCIGLACPAVYWCTRDVFQISIINFGKIYSILFFIQKVVFLFRPTV